MAEATQDGRFMRVESGLGKDVLLLKRFAGVEAISEPFSVEMEVFATRAVKGTDLLEKPLCVVFGHEDDVGERFIHGQVRSLTALGRDGEFHAYRLNIAPWLWFLSLYRDCRIFQGMTVTDIVEKVFSDRGYSDYRIDCNSSFGVREFTVQYGESDLAFVSRLLEEEGIFYFFEHEKEKHTMVLADHRGALTASPIQPDVRYLNVRGSAIREATIHQLSVESAVHTGRSVLADFHFERPSADLTADIAGDGIGAFYDYPGRYHEKAQGNRFAKIRLEAQEALAETVEGTSDCFGLIPGFRFNLKESDVDDDYLVTGVHHQSGIQHYRSDAAAVEVDDLYRNSFTAIPYATPFRPEWRTPRPRLGVQTAVVVGPSGQEIYTDKYGRVKVRFHWDRESPKDEKSSCWIRVASTWAGNKWGAFQVPRIGQEVVVEFLEGDPDRPLITGSVYNAQQMPPFGATPTQSGWKSHSTKQGGADSNEFRFEDKKGSEEIHLRAEKDLKVEVVNDETVTVGHDRKTTIKNDETIQVDHDRKATVKNDETLEVQNDRKRKVANDETVKVAGKQTVEVDKDQTITVKTGDRSVQVKMGDLTTKAALGKMSFEAMQSIELKVGTNSIKIDQTGITMKGMMVKIEGKTMTEVKGLMTKVESQVMTQVKGVMVQVDGSAMLMAKGGISMIG
jgi:type VI secretion system secreted protein VgrG